MPKTFLLYYSKFRNIKFILFIVSNPVITTLFLVIFVVFFSFPSYDVAFITNEMEGSWSAIFAQSKNPFVNHNHLYGIGSHEEKLAFRFVPAIILNFLNINSIGLAMVFQFITMIIFYFILVHIYNKLFLDKIKAFVFMLPICLVFAGHVYVSDYKGVFDTLALCFLLLSFLFKGKAYIIIPLLFAYFTDERALIASTAIILINFYESEHFKSITAILKYTFTIPNIYVISSWILYFIIRIYLHVSFGLETGTGGIDLFFEHLDKSFFTFYVGLEAYFIPLCLVIWALYRKKCYSYISMILICFFILFVLAQSVVDINRSMSYVILFLILITRMFDDLFPQQKVWQVITLVIILNMFWGDAYPFLAQLYRMKFITGSI